VVLSRIPAAVGILNDITDAKRIHETVEQIFEHGSSPIILVCMVIESKHQHLDMVLLPLRS
jgi:hypothetical protein